MGRFLFWGVDFIFRLRFRVQPPPDPGIRENVTPLYAHPISENFEISILFAGEYAKAKRTVKSGVEGSEKSSSVEVFCDELMDGRPLLQDVTIGKIYCALREKGSSEILRLRLHSNSAQGLLVFSMVIAHRTLILLLQTQKELR